MVLLVDLHAEDSLQGNVPACSPSRSKAHASSPANKVVRLFWESSKPLARRCLRFLPLQYPFDLLQDVLNEIERNLHDAMGVARNVALDPRLVPGGGAVEMAVSRGLNDKSASVSQMSTGCFDIMVGAWECAVAVQ